MPKNYLLGSGEKMAEPFRKPRRKFDKLEVYTNGETKARLMPQLISALDYNAKIPILAKPENNIVLKVILNPAYLAKSYFPAKIIENHSLRVIGSRNISMTPVKWNKKADPFEANTLQLFVAGKTKDFERLGDSLNKETFSNDLNYVEAISQYTPKDRLKGFHGGDFKNKPCELVLHASAFSNDDFIFKGMVEFANNLGISLDIDRTHYVGRLSFLPALLSDFNYSQLAQYSFLRVLRPMPAIRFADKISSESRIFSLPKELNKPTTERFNVSILDGGFIANPLLSSYVRAKKVSQHSMPDGEQHGTWVSSAYLYGPLKDENDLPTPISNVDNWQVYDATDPSQDMFTTIENIIEVLDKSPNQLSNLSIGPCLPIEDDEVTLWTALIDKKISKGNHLLTVAVGNYGEQDWESGNARIQPPSDCVNALSIGSSTTEDNSWARSPYSCIGKGRSPGIIKPDLVEFGGSEGYSFWVFDGSDSPKAVPVSGTSFSAPYILRKAAQIKASIDSDITPMALKAILIHNAKNDNKHETIEVGWGKTSNQVESMITCKNNQATVLYQGTIKPKKASKLPVPIPELTKSLGGKIRISITICFSTDTDPSFPSTYTRSGIVSNFYTGYDKENKPVSYTFFSGLKYKMSEHDLRTSLYKWETVIKQSKNINIEKLTDPFFVLHFVPRAEGGDFYPDDELKYSMIISLESQNDVHLYNHVVTEYHVLEELRPVQEIQVFS
jgi:hypothetical protein